MNTPHITPSRTFPSIKREIYYQEVDAIREDNADLYKEYDRLMAIENLDLQIALRVARVRASHTIYRHGMTVVYYDGVSGHMSSKCFHKESHAAVYKENLQLTLIIEAGNRALSAQLSNFFDDKE